MHNSRRLARRFSYQHLFQAAALLIACVAAWPLLSEPGLLNSTRGGGDSPFLLQRLHQMEMALRGGHFPVRWMPDANLRLWLPILQLLCTTIFLHSGCFPVHWFQLRSLYPTSAVAGIHNGRNWYVLFGAAMVPEQLGRAVSFCRLYPGAISYGQCLCARRLHC